VGSESLTSCYQGDGIDPVPALKREESSAGQRAGPASPLATSRSPESVRWGSTGFVRDTPAPRGVWRIRHPFGRSIRLHRASHSSQRDGGDAPGCRFPRVRPRSVSSACLPVLPRWAGTSGRGSLFACPVAAASVTPPRKRCGGLRRPGRVQSNCRFLSVVVTTGWAVRGLNSDGCGLAVGFIPALEGRGFLLDSL